MIHYYTGFDYFTPDAGTTELMHCVACAEQMEVKRDVSRIEHGRWGCMAKVGEPCTHPTRVIDIFSCGYSGEAWHDQVISLKRFQRDTPSQVLSNLVEEEILGIIKTKVPTKENWGL